ncbi:MAG: hypothetical protein JJE34_09750 [Alphaproteobacteria bacterium]|nr:hypothetical protein [Alphaproteobacteria bacterium]
MQQKGADYRRLFVSRRKFLIDSATNGRTEIRGGREAMEKGAPGIGGADMIS